MVMTMDTFRTVARMCLLYDGHHGQNGDGGDDGKDDVSCEVSGDGDRPNGDEG